MQKKDSILDAVLGSQGDLGIIMGIDNEEVDEHDEHDSQYIPCSTQGNYWPGKPLPTVKYRSSLKSC